MIEIIEYKAVGKGYLQGTFSLKVPKWGGFIMRDCSYFEKGEQRWVNLPSRQYEENGQKKYFPLVTFEEQKMQEDFKKQVVNALQLHISENKIA